MRVLNARANIIHTITECVSATNLLAQLPCRGAHPICGQEKTENSRRLDGVCACHWKATPQERVTYLSCNAWEVSTDQRPYMRKCTVFQGIPILCNHSCDRAEPAIIRYPPRAVHVSAPMRTPGICESGVCQPMNDCLCCAWESDHFISRQFSLTSKMFRSYSIAFLFDFEASQHT